ncbi:hamartin-like [Acanthaster planci]|uniref:Hamartin-like n=1 Tax=Acanthaster planci TaxID=133434 RepID=A0A8B7XW82_ACAPL|nr:hamartin-like [Acanthaster planci]XP_022085128.1 hamartin-like [Acanthaster planci]
MSVQIPDPSELFPLLLSNDLHVIQEIKSLIQDSLNSARDPGFLNALVDFYIHTNSNNALELLAGIREPLDKPLMDRLNDNMKAGHKLQSLTLLSHVVRHQPSWLHKIVQAPLFTSLLNCLRMDTDVPVIMCGLLTVTTLLPMIPSLVSPFLQDIFGIFSRLASWTMKKPGGIPDVYHLHIQVAVYALFHRLYGMYPWSFLQHLRFYYQNKKIEFEAAVLPMLERVRMHPSLITGSAQSEMEKTRWRQMEVHDVLMECARVSLDTTESARDDSFSFTAVSVGHDLERSGSKGMTGQGIRTSSPIVDPQGVETAHKPVIQWENDTKKRDPDAQSLVSSQEGGISMFSPSMVCGLSTPPQSHPPSPQGSQLDISLTSSVHLLYTTPHLDTPTPLSTPRDSPHPSAAARLSSRMSSMSDTSVHSRGSKSKASWGKLPPIATQSSMALGRTVSAPVTPGYETKSLPTTPQKPLIQAKAASHEITKQRRFVWEDANLSDSLHSNGDLSLMGKQHNEEDMTEAETRTERAESSVSLKDLPGVIKDLNHEEERPKDVEAMNEEVSSFTDSPCALRDFENSGGSGGNVPIQSQTTQKTSDASEEMDSTEVSSSSDQPTLTKAQESYASHQLNGNARPETVRTQSDPSASYRSAAVKSLVESESRPRTSSVGSKPVSNISADLFGVRRSQEATTEQRSTYQGFLPISDSSESPILRPGAQSTASAASSILGPSYFQQASLQMPYKHLFNLILPTLQNLTSAGSANNSPSVSSANTTGSGLYATPPPASRAESALSGGTPIDNIGTVPLHSLYSPSQLLDRHLQLGNQIHDDQLIGLPLTSQESVDWTHFGGSPPVDEIKLLKGQLQLLHNQLLYERHKREVHAERNRRLLGKTHKAKALEESNAAMQKQLQLLEMEVNQLKAAFKLLREENKQLVEANFSKDQTHNTLIKKLQSDNDRMKDAKEELQKLLVDHRLQVDKVTKELQTVNAEFFTVQQELENTRADIATNRHLKDEIARLNKELLLMGETNVKFQERVSGVQRDENMNDEREMSWITLKKDLAASQEALKVKSVQLEAAHARITEMEALLSQKELAMAEQKRFLENVKSLTKGKIEAMDGKYSMLQKINQRLEAHILKLTKHLKEKDRRHYPSVGSVISRSQSLITSQTENVPKGSRSDSLDSGQLLRSVKGSRLIQKAPRPALERSQSHEESQQTMLLPVFAGSSQQESIVQSQSSKSSQVVKETPPTTSSASGSHLSPHSSPMSDWEHVSSETIPKSSRVPKQPAEAIRVPVPVERARIRDESPSHLNVNSPPLIFSESSPFQRVQQSPRLGTRHSSLSPSSKIPLNSPGRIAISSGPKSQSCPNLEADIKTAVSPCQFTGAFPAQAEEGEESLQEGEEAGGSSSTPPAAVVDSMEPSMLHHSLAAMVHMEASIEEADLTKL